MEFDVLINDATIVEGTGKKAYPGSIGVKGDRVAALGQVKGDAVRIIDGKGLTALPGFIDAHSHADLTLPWYPKAQSYVMQGVTTFVGGQCGWTEAPLGEYMVLPPLLEDHLAVLDPYKFYPPHFFYPTEKAKEWMKEIFGWTMDWDTMGGFFKHLEKTSISVNYAPLVGHRAIRICAMGLDYKRYSTQQERERMHELIHQAMRDGCIGMSFGLDYDPDVFASLEEITEAVAQLKEYNGIFCPHWRRTGRRMNVSAGHVPNEKITALMECVEVQRKTGVRLHFAHLSTGWNITPTPPDELEEANVRTTINMILKDRKNDLDVTWDAIPFLARGGFEVMPYICSLLEPWLRELGSREALARWLKVKDFREEVKDAIRRGLWYIREGYNPNTNPRWAENITVLKSSIPGIDGKSVAQIARERKGDPFDTWLDIIAEDPDARGVTGATGIRKAYYPYYTHPSGMVGLDVFTWDDGYQLKYPPYSIGGINAFSAFPLVLNHFVRDEKVFTLEEVVQKTSTMAARVHNLEGRGVIGLGSYADIVLIDLPNLKVMSTELEPRRHPDGIKHVLVNGVPVVENGKHTGETPGRILRRKS
jgi:N-acyl-D-amino-acid deacylase